VFEFRVLHLCGRHSTTWAMTSALFALVIFWDRVSLYALADLSLSILCASLYSWDDRSPQPLVKLGSHWLFAWAGLELQSSWSPPLE
jgi:hypothetical protein